MRKRNNPIPLEHQRPRQIHIGFADENEEQEALPTVYDWDRNCDGETYENLDLRHIDFGSVGSTERASLVGTSFINCDLRRCAFRLSILSNTNFQGSDLRDANFKFIEILENADFENCNLSGAIFGERGDYTTCKWNNTNIEGANFRNKDFILFFLEHRKIPNAFVYIHGTPTFERANLSGADLHGANLQYIYLNRANLQGANLQGANLQGAKLYGANLQGANLQNANLQGTNLEEANLQGANLRGTQLQGASYYLTKGLTRKQKSVMLWAKHYKDR